MGSTADGAMTVYLRPETAQGIFVNYLNVQKTGRMRLPFGIAQIGKAFRNEIVARQFIFRMREFEQMEMQFFVRPGEELKWFAQWKEWRLAWHKALGLGDQKYRYHDHEKLAHYANAATDIEFEMPFGFKEVEGIHSRTNFDLSQHEKFSGKNIKYFDPELNESYVPYVIETSIGVDRMFLSVLCSKLRGAGARRWRQARGAPPSRSLAPVKCAVLPLVKKDGLPEKAREIVNDLKFDFATRYDEKDSIGKRYRRQDAIGTPFCITVDHQSLEDNTVTLRHRDSMEQISPARRASPLILILPLMKSIHRIILIAVAIVMTAGLSSCNYNSLVEKQQGVDQAWAEVEKPISASSRLDTQSRCHRQGLCHPRRGDISESDRGPGQSHLDHHRPHKSQRRDPR